MSDKEVCDASFPAWNEGRLREAGIRHPSETGLTSHLATGQWS